MRAKRTPQQECAPRSPAKWMMFVEFPMATMLAAFYEISEMWDGLYFGGDRSKGIVGTPRDLQFDLIGSVGGAILTCTIMKGIELGLPRRSEKRATSDEISGLFQMQRSKP